MSALLVGKWFQTSSRYMMVARLPEGMTGLEALAKASPEAYCLLVDRMETEAAETYLRVYASPEDQKTLTAEEWVEYKNAGGRTYR